MITTRRSVQIGCRDRFPADVGKRQKTGGQSRTTVNGFRLPGTLAIDSVVGTLVSIKELLRATQARSMSDLLTSRHQNSPWVFSP